MKYLINKLAQFKQWILSIVIDCNIKNDDFSDVISENKKTLKNIDKFDKGF